MVLIGITGAISHGKTSLARYLVDGHTDTQHYESSDIIIEVANGLKLNNVEPSAEDASAIMRWLAALPLALQHVTGLDCTLDDLKLTQQRLEAGEDEFQSLRAYLRLVEFEPGLSSRAINSSNKVDFRLLLQWLGGYLAQNLSGQLWFGEIVRRSRQTNAALVIAGGVRFPADADYLRSAGAKIIAITRSDMASQDLHDLTERHRERIIPDCRINNDGSLEALRQTARVVRDDLLKNTLGELYRCSNYEQPTRTGLTLGN